MRGKSINLFMWGYQRHFQFQFERLMNNVMKELNISGTRAECLLVGAKIPSRKNPNNVCIEPEDGKWPIGLFDGLLDAIEAEVTDHPLQNIYYGDAPSMQDKPENIRRDSVCIAIQKALSVYDEDHDVRSFVSESAPVGDYYIVPVLQIPNELFKRFRPLREPVTDDYFNGHASLIHAAVFKVLSEAYDELLRPDPGRYVGGRSRSPEEIVRRAAESFMHTPGVSIGNNNAGISDLFEQFNLISSLVYEGAKGVGRLLLANPDSGSVHFLLKLADPVAFREHRWSRKVLQMASSEIALIADCEKIFGLGDVAAGIDPWMDQNLFEIEFLDHYHWRLSCGEEIMLDSRYGVPSLPEEEFPSDRHLDTYQRLFPKSGEKDIARFSELCKVALDQRHGSMMVVAEDAESEANRLQNQGTRIEPIKLTPELYRQVSGIDGTILVDPYGICHAIGVILDGPSRPECTPSRGSRYNSGLRYVYAVGTPRLAVVISDDRMVDVIPVLRPRIQRSSIDKAISELEAATRDNYHQAMNWLDNHRFYLNQRQCDQINAVLKRIESEPMETGKIYPIWNTFSPHPDLNDSYFESPDIQSASS